MKEKGEEEEKKNNTVRKVMSREQDNFFLFLCDSMQSLRLFYVSLFSRLHFRIDALMELVYDRIDMYLKQMSLFNWRKVQVECNWQSSSFVSCRRLFDWRKSSVRRTILLHFIRTLIYMTTFTKASTCVDLNLFAFKSTEITRSN